MTQMILPMKLRHSAKPRHKNAELIVDSFAGGGGASTGIELAMGRAVDIAINHDADAIHMHGVNHPETRHYREDVWAIDPVKVCQGRPVGLAWFSPDCKHFSRAKGSKPASKRIRGLAWVAVKWAKTVRPRVIMLENVREFQDWGPLLPNNMPDPAKKGQTFRRFVAMLQNLGYQVEWKVLNAADCGAPTNRRRLFLVARCDGAAIVWPEPTHGAVRQQGDGTKRPQSVSDGANTHGSDGDRFHIGATACGSHCATRARKKGEAKSPDSRPGTSPLLPYRTAAECIDWTVPCPSIFGRKRPLAEKTMKRIAMGLKKYVLDNPQPFVVNVQHGGDEFRGQGVDQPLSTVTGKHGYGVVTPYVCGVGGRAGQSPATAGNAPVGTITAKNDRVVVMPHLVEVANSNWSDGHRPADALMPTVTANPKGGEWAMASATLIGAGGPEYAAKPAAVDTPMGTLTAENHRAACVAFLNKHYGGVVGHEVERLIGTITAVDHHSLSVAHLTKLYGTSVGADPAEPMPTVTAGGNHLGEVRAFLLRYYSSGGQVIAADAPAPTITTRHRLGLVTIHGQDYQIVDIGLRMLTPRELLRAQFSPELAEDYVLTGSAANQVAKIGNSVAPLVAAALVRANMADGVCPGKEA